MTILSVAQYQTSAPVFAPVGAIVTVTPSNGATVNVEYTKGSAADIANGVAVWKTWTKGLVTAVAADLLDQRCYLRFTATGGSASINIDEIPSPASMLAFSQDWGVGSVVAITGGTIGGTPIAQIAAGTTVLPTAMESKYTKALYFPPPPRRANQLASMGDPLWAASYLGSMADADLYDTAPGFLTTGLTAAKALMVYSAIANNAIDGLPNWASGGGSVFVQHQFKVPSLAAQVELFGNLPEGNNNTGGINAFITTTGQLNIGYGIVGTFGANVAPFAAALVINTIYTLSVLFDGTTNTLSVWLNGVASTLPAAANQLLLPSTGTSIPVASNFGIGCVLGSATSTTVAAQLQTKAFRLVAIPSGKVLRAPASLDLAFNRNPLALFNDVDMVGAG